MPENASQRIAKEMLARFPIQVAPIPDTNVGKSFDVGVPVFKVSLNRAAAATAEIGRYDASVHVKSNVALEGFRGGIYIRFLDDQGNVVYAMSGDSYGVNGTAIPGAPSETEKQEVKFIPLDILSAVHSVEVRPVRMEGPTWEGIQRTINEIAQGAEAIKEGLKRLGATVEEIGAAIKS